MKEDFNELEEFDFNDDDFQEIEDLEAELDDLSDDLEDSQISNNFNPRIIKAKKYKELKSHQVKFRHAKDLAKKVDLTESPRYDCIVSGNFIFGDFIEAFLVGKNIKITEMTIATLSMSRENIDSLVTLMQKGYVDNLNIIISDFFYSHERNNLIQYMYEALDVDDRFQLSVTSTHAKVYLLKTLGGKKIVIHGSTNMRTCGNIEHFTIEINESLYDFYRDFYKEIESRYKTINKTIGDRELKKLF
ncbi:hypothetical protein ACQ1PF_07940 [Ornithobacterium rhinotracheale]